jgi:hypothetical protein
MAEPTTQRRRILIISVAAVVVIVGYAYLRNRTRASRAAATTVDETTGTAGADVPYLNPAPVTTRDATVDTTGGQGLISNDGWYRQVLADMAESELFEPGFAASALGKYLNGVGLTGDEANVVRVAIGLRGYPPQGNLTIQLVSGASTPGSGTPNPAPAPPPPATAPTTPTRRFTVPTPSQLFGRPHVRGPQPRQTGTGTATRRP